MKYLNAFEGIKKIYKAEIMSIIAAVLSLVAGVLSAIGTASDNGAVVGAGIVVIIAAILLIVAEIMNISGVSRASKDESAFKKALTALIIGIGANFLVCYFSENQLLSGIGSFVCSITEFLASFFVCTGIINLAESLSDKAVSNNGRKTRTFLMYLFLASAALSLLSALLDKNGALASVISVVSSLVSIAAYIIYFSVLGKSKAMLENNLK